MDRGSSGDVGSKPSSGGDSGVVRCDKCLSVGVVLGLYRRYFDTTGIYMRRDVGSKIFIGGLSWEMTEGA